MLSRCPFDISVGIKVFVIGLSQNLFLFPLKGSNNSRHSKNALEVDIQLLTGRDLIEAHQVLQQITRPESTPFAQRLRLGWYVVGEVCRGMPHKPDNMV